jgi:hypothetical protein
MAESFTESSQVDPRLEKIHFKLHSSIRCLLEAWNGLQSTIPARSEDFDRHIDISNSMSEINLAIAENREVLMMFGDLNPSIVKHCQWRNCGYCGGFEPA